MADTLSSLQFLPQGCDCAANWLILTNSDPNFVISEISVNQVRKCFRAWGVGVFTIQEQPCKCYNCIRFRRILANFTSGQSHPCRRWTIFPHHYLRPSKKIFLFQVTLWEFFGSVGRKKSFSVKKVYGQVQKNGPRQFLELKIEGKVKNNEGERYLFCTPNVTLGDHFFHLPLCYIYH